MTIWHARGAADVTTDQEPSVANQSADQTPSLPSLSVRRQQLTWPLEISSERTRHVSLRAIQVCDYKMGPEDSLEREPGGRTPPLDGDSLFRVVMQVNQLLLVVDG